VYYYKRNISKTKLFNSKPYIVVTRDSKDLMSLLLQDDYPILFEGLHTTYFLSDKRLRERRKIVRTHNIEHDYYHNLATVEKDLFKRYYFLNEAGKLAKYEKILEHAEGIAAISKNDTTYLSTKFKNVQTVSAFHANESISSKPGKGSFALYHGSLEIGENNEAALYLVKNIFAGTKQRFVIAGNKPSKELKAAVADKPNIELKTGITSEDIYELISDAHINILPTFQSTGIKLKLLAALFRGRHCLVNTPMIENTGLESLCICKDSVEDIKEEVARLFQTDFYESEIQKREEVLLRNGFSNEHNAQTLIKMLLS
jgi:glycosyltransferase involved in cell wall biosynthesis